MRRTRLTALIAATAWLLTSTGCHHRPDPNTPEGRARLEAERREEEADRRERDEKRARKEARKRDRERDREERRGTPTNGVPIGVTASDSQGATAPTAAATAQPGTCDASCQHYLTCKGAAATTSQRECVLACARMNLPPQTLAGFERTDCANAIAIVERTASGQSAPRAKPSSCQGCVWDGSSCIWLSQSNWGAGPYSGAYSSCDPGCCR